MRPGFLRKFCALGLALICVIVLLEATIYRQRPVLAQHHPAAATSTVSSPSPTACDSFAREHARRYSWSHDLSQGTTKGALAGAFVGGLLGGWLGAGRGVMWGAAIGALADRALQANQRYDMAYDDCTKGIMPHETKLSRN